MSIIYSYPEETSLQGSDMLIGTSTALVGGKQKNITKNFTLDQLTSFIQGGEGVINPAASDFQIAVFNQSGAKLTGSIMSQERGSKKVQLLLFQKPTASLEQATLLSTGKIWISD